MNLMRLVLPAVLLLGLAGCFTSDGPLLTAEKADFPYQKITYAEEYSDAQTVLQRTDDGYVAVSDDAEPVIFLFQKVADDTYLAQVSGKDNTGAAQYLYAVLKIDTAGKTAKAYKAVSDDSDTGPGREACGDGLICITDLQAYVDFALKAIADGEEPETTYRIINLE